MVNYTIPFNKPYLSGSELEYIADAVRSGKISGDGVYTKKCHRFFAERYNFKKCLLTTSCTDALEMAAILLDIKPGDEVIMPSYTFVSTANAFVLHGATVVFADCCADNPNMDVTAVEKLITPNTKAIVAMHYAGVACHMDELMALAAKHKLLVVEDAALSIDSYYKGQPLGSIGHLSAFSFHETKNIIAGEGGMLVINDERFNERAEIIREKGTNRSRFFRGEVDKYNWVDVGSSFLPSDLLAAFLYAQLESIDRIQQRRKQIWTYYNTNLQHLQQQGFVKLPVIPDYATNNAHMFYMVTRNANERAGLIDALKQQGILAIFHYLSLHNSPYYTQSKPAPHLPNAEMFTDCLVRLPLYYELTEPQQQLIVSIINNYYAQLK